MIFNLPHTTCQTKVDHSEKNQFCDIFFSTRFDLQRAPVWYQNYFNMFQKKLSFQLTWNEDSSEVWCHSYKKHNATICEITFASQEYKAVFCETNMQESSDIVVSYFLKAWLPGNTGAPGVIQNLSLKYIGKMCSTLFSTPTMLWFVTSLCKHRQIDIKP